jgi:hypothetical protein
MSYLPNHLTFYLLIHLTYLPPTQPNKINNVKKINSIVKGVNDYEKILRFNINLAISKHF